MEVLKRTWSKVFHKHGHELLDSSAEDEPKTESSGVVEQPEFTCDEAIDLIGVGKFQVILCVLCGMCWSADAMEMMLLSFLLPAASEEFKLEPWKQATIGSAVFTGMLFGSSIWGLSSDRFGRKFVFLATSALTGVFGMLSAFSPNYYWLLLFRAIVGFGLGGAHVAFSLFAEFLPQNNRGKPLIMFEIFWTIGTVAEAALAWIVLPLLSWRWLLGISSIPVLLLLLCYPWLPESPRYLLVNGNYDKAIKQLEAAALMNKTNLPTGKLINPTMKDNSMKFHLRLFELISRPMIKVTLLMWLIWFANNFVYYGLVLFTPALYKSEEKEENNQNGVFMDVLITSLAEAPGLFIATFGIDKFGRKKTLAMMFFGCSASIALLTIKAGQFYLITFSVFARMFIMGSFSSVYVYTQEVYPTMIRSTGLGVCSSVSRIAGILTPFVSDVLSSLKSSDSMWMPILIYSLVVFMAGCASFFLPFETQGRATEEAVPEPLPPPIDMEFSPLVLRASAPKTVELYKE